MKTPDLDKERSEEKLSVGDFLLSYNDDLPSEFPRASLSLLREFKETYPSLFKDGDTWTLGQHRKRLMDWLPQRLKVSVHS
jgi:hypothetical protein